jgi:hypothetical protein
MTPFPSTQRTSKQRRDLRNPCSGSVCRSIHAFGVLKQFRHRDRIAASLPGNADRPQQAGGGLQLFSQDGAPGGSVIRIKPPPGFS